MWPLKKARTNQASFSQDQVYVQRTSTHANAPRPFNNAKPMLVDTMPVVPDNRSYADSFFYREGRDPAHQYSRVTVPLNFNPTFGSATQIGFTPGARIMTEAVIAVPRNQNAGMRAQNPRANQVRPAAGSYGTQSVQAQGQTRYPSATMSKWLP